MLSFCFDAFEDNSPYRKISVLQEIFNLRPGCVGGGYFNVAFLEHNTFSLDDSMRRFLSLPGAALILGSLVAPGLLDPALRIVFFTPSIIRTCFLS